MDLLKRRLMMLPKYEPYIRFADPYAEAFCANAFGDGVGVTKRMARKVKTDRFKTALENFQDRTLITSFDEFRYFNHVAEAGKWKDCTLLTSITLPKSCNHLEAEAFMNCTSLERINFDWVQTMRYRAFMNCTSLQIDVVIPNLNNVNDNYGMDYDMFNSSGVTKVLNLGTVRDLGGYSSFRNCQNMTEAWVPETVIKIGDLTFYQCPNLMAIILLPETPPTLVATRAIGGATGRKIYVPYSADHSILNAYKTADKWSTFENDFVELNPDGTVPTEL